MGDIETESPDLSKTKLCGTCCPMSWRKKKPVESQQSLTTTIDATPDTPAFVGDLPKPLLPGHCIRVTGKPQKNCERFAINFKCSNNENSDILFHFNPRLAENYIVRNSRHHGKWQKEETESLLRPNLIRNYRFTFSFFIAPTEFMVSINGHHFCVFSFRMPLAKASIVEVEGNVDVDEVEVTEATSYPTEDLPPKVPFDDVYKKVAITLPNPFIGHLDKGFQTGWQLEIYGKVKMLPHSFYINLQKGSFLWPHPIIPLHLNPRFNASTLNRVLIRNSWEKNEWGTEERSPGFYFMPSKPFHLIIQLDLERALFIVWVDGKLQGEFHVRNMYNAKQIDTVHIEGDLNIYKVFMKTSFTVNQNE